MVIDVVKEELNNLENDFMFIKECLWLTKDK